MTTVANRKLMESMLLDATSQVDTLRLQHSDLVAALKACGHAKSWGDAQAIIDAALAKVTP